MYRDITQRLLLMLGLLWTLSPLGQPPATQAEQTLAPLLTAIAQQNYSQFVADGTAQFKAEISEPQLQAVADNLSRRPKEGYQVQYLTQLDQQGHEIHLWKISFTDQADEHLAKLAL